MTIIDSHAHIFPEKISEKAVKSIGDFYGLPMRGLGTAPDYASRATEAGFAAAIVNSSATKAGQVRSINEFILKEVRAFECAQNEDRIRLYGLISLHPELSAAEIDNEIRFAKDNGLIGIKLHPDFQCFNIDDKRAYNLYAAAEGVLPILFHTGDDRYEFSKPEKLVRVMKQFKNLKVQAAHFGGYSRWDELECYKDVIGNVFFDTSSSLFKLPKEQAIQIIGFFGTDKFFFGTDYPMWAPSEELKRFYALGFNDAENEAMLAGNVKHFYGI